MSRRFSVKFTLLYIVVDLLLISLALTFASSLRPMMNTLPFAKDIEKVFTLPWSIPWNLYPFLLILWLISFLFVSLYDARKKIRAISEFATLTLGTIIAGISSAGVLFLSHRGVSRLLFLTFVFLAYLFLVLWRIAYRLAFKFGDGKADQKRHVLIVGAGSVGRRFQKYIRENPYLGLDIVGFLDDDLQKKELYQDVLGTLKDASRILKEEQVDDIVLALPKYATKRINFMIYKLHEFSVNLYVIPDYFSKTFHKAKVINFAGMPMIGLREPVLNNYQRVLKRVFDLTISFLLMPILLPIMSCIAIAIKLDSTGPVLFLQNRVGENRRLFKMLKFRTMVENAEELRHLVEYNDEEGYLMHKKKNDPRVTGVGRFLRRASLDELPQLFNVLKGDMSLVGPRPELPYLVEQYEPWQQMRFSVPQGITGWWQVNGRSDNPMHLHTEDDLYYIQNYSVFLDIQILLKTPGVVFIGKGAY